MENVTIQCVDDLHEFVPNITAMRIQDNRIHVSVTDNKDITLGELCGSHRDKLGTWLVLGIFDESDQVLKIDENDTIEFLSETNQTSARVSVNGNEFEFRVMESADEAIVHYVTKNDTLRGH